MPLYTVTLPITGSIVIDDIEAESADEAIAKALSSDAISKADIEEWQTHECIVGGNVFYGSLNKATADLIG